MCRAILVLSLYDRISGRRRRPRMLVAMPRPQCSGRKNRGGVAASVRAGLAIAREHVR